MNNFDMFFGLVAPIGTKIDLLQKSLEAEILTYEYDVKVIKISEIIESIARKLNIDGYKEKNIGIQDKIALGNKICKIAEARDFWGNGCG